MKNKLLVSVFATGIALLAFTSCKSESDVIDVCNDLVQASIHKSARSLVELKGEVLSIYEYEFPSKENVKDDRLIYRTISFGNGVYEPKKVDEMTYQYGEWNADHTSFSLYVTPESGEPYTLWYKGNAFVTEDGRVIGGEGTANTARVAKWEKTLNSFPNTKWEGTYRAEFVMDSVFRDSIRATFIPPMSFKYDTIKVFDHMDTISADTTCIMRFEVNHDASTLANTGHLYKKSVRSKYNRETKTEDIISVTEKEYDCTWCFSDVSSDSKFEITMKSTTAGVEGDVLSISKYKVDDAGNATGLLSNGINFTRPAIP